MSISPDRNAVETAVNEGKLNAEVAGFILTCAMLAYQTLASAGAFTLTAAFEIEKQGVALLPEDNTPFRTKDLFMEATRHFADHFDAKHVAIICECWTVAQPEGTEPNLDKPFITGSLANHPDRREALIVLCEHNDLQIRLTYEIERAPDEKITGISFQSLDIYPQDKVTGRLTRLRFTDDDRKTPEYASSRKAMEFIFASMSKDEVPLNSDQLGSKHRFN